jgi:hypothetical protein
MRQAGRRLLRAPRTPREHQEAGDIARPFAAQRFFLDGDELEACLSAR